MEKISPTRMNLLSRKSQYGLAIEGVELLRNKREVLMSQFMDIIKPLLEQRKELQIEMMKAFHCLNTARSIDGKEGLQAASLLKENTVTIDIRKENFWGVEIPVIDSVQGFGHQYREPHSHGVSLRIFETRDRFDKILQKIIEFAPLEARLKRLGREIQKTTRRINALEEMLIPRLQAEIRFIRSTLEEREREDNFRLRRIKNKRETKKR